MIHIAICSTSNLQHDADDPSERIGRAVPKTISVEVAPSVNQKPPTIQETVGRHMKLARVFNALYLQMQLADDQIDEFDVIASIWNLKDRTSVEELFRLQVHEIVDLLKPLETAIKGVDENVTQVVDVKGVSDAYAKIDGYVTEEDRMNLMNARGDDVIPPFIQEGFKFIRANNLTINMADFVVKKIEAIEIRVGEQDNIELASLIQFYYEIIRDLPHKVENAMKDTDKNFNALIDGFRSSLKIQQKAADFQPLSDQLSSIESNMQELSTIKNYAGVSQTKKYLDQIRSFLYNFPRSPKSLPIGSTFSGSHNLRIISNDIDDLWLGHLLNKSLDLKKFRDAFQNFNKFANQFSNVTMMTSVFGTEHVGTVDLFLDLLSVFEKFQALSKIVNTTLLKTCVHLPDKLMNVNIDEVTQISNDWDEVISKVPELNDKLGSIPERTRVEMRRKINKLYSLDIEEFKIWAKTNELEELKTFFQELTPAFESLKMDNEFVMAAGRLEEAKPKLDDVQEFVRSFKVGEKECDAVFESFDLKAWENLNRLFARFKRLRAKSPIEKLNSLLDVLWDTIIELRNVAAPNSPHSSRPKRSTSLDRVDFRAKNPQNLLEFVFSARSLEVMEEVHRHDRAIETILESGDVIRQRIQSIDDPVMKANLTEVWKGFDATKASLEAIQGDIKQVFAKIGATMEESTLKEVGATYEELGAISESKYEKIELSGYRQSLVDIPSLPVDRNFNDLEEAFKELERPMSMDFEMSFAHFRKVPRVLAELQEDFDNFFADEKSQEEEGSFGYGWIIFLLCVGVSLLSAIISRVIYYRKYIQDPEMKQQCPIQKNFSPTLESIDKNYTYMQFQDDRFPINQRDSNGNTKMFNALLKGAGSEMAQLILSGAILNATCNGYKHRTALFELLLVRERIWCESLMANGADQTIHDYAGEDADTWAEHYGFMDLFQKFYDKRKRFLPSRRFPSEPRPWNILVFDSNCFPRKFRKNLPLLIKKNTTWGYKKGMNLDDFTMIIMPKKYLYGEKTLRLSTDDLTTFKLYGCAATLVNVSFFHALLKCTPEDRQKILNEDYNHWIFNTLYDDQLHENTVIKLKTNIHQMQPKLLDGVKISFYQTNFSEKVSKHKEWCEIIRMFGGQVLDEPIPDTDETVLPYHTMSYEYKQVFKEVQNAMWILKFDDSEVFAEHVHHSDQYTVAKIGFLPECLARYFLLGINNQVFPLEIEPTVKDPDDRSRRSADSTFELKQMIKAGRLDPDVLEPLPTKKPKPYCVVEGKNGRKTARKGQDVSPPAHLPYPTRVPKKEKSSFSEK